MRCFGALLATAGIALSLKPRYRLGLTSGERRRLIHSFLESQGAVLVEVFVTPLLAYNALIFKHTLHRSEGFTNGSLGEKAGMCPAVPKFHRLRRHVTCWAPRLSKALKCVHSLPRSLDVAKRKRALNGNAYVSLVNKTGFFGTAKSFCSSPLGYTMYLRDNSSTRCMTSELHIRGHYSLYF